MNRQAFPMNHLLNPNHQELFQATDREILVRGGANAGKSYSIADKLLIQGSIIQSQTPIKALVIKQTQPSLRDTVIDILSKRAEMFHLPLKINLNNLTAQCGNMQFLFRSMFNLDDYKKIKSYTDIDYIWINEIIDLREADYRMLKSRLRGGFGSWSQMISDFNPVGKTSWVFERFYEKNVGNAKKLLYTVLDNPWASDVEVDDLKNSINDDSNYYKIYFLGEWGELEGIIFNWDVAYSPPGNPDEIFYGGDFGYSVDPACLLRIYRKSNEFWLEEIIYEVGLTNQELAVKMDEEEIDGDVPQYWDSAEPKSIQELCDHVSSKAPLGFNAIPCEKGPDSVRAGIDYMKGLTIHILSTNRHPGENIIKEQKSYIWKKDKDGRSLNVPIEHDNHAMSAGRYGIFTHCRLGQPAAGVPSVGTGDIWG